MEQNLNPSLALTFLTGTGPWVLRFLKLEELKKQF